MSLPVYAELHCRSNFSFLTGATHPEELVAREDSTLTPALSLEGRGSNAGGCG